ncbi:MAG TPA: glycyl-radical enzyme activating protein [Anaerolineales bacterium]|nr:glycyl-radical enzyme activating protein [Anaerolineales bacterium]
MNDPEPTGRILNLQRLSTEDGPGIRTTVFFKGCPLHCAWCHNPESLSARLQTQWFSVRCIGCQTCVKTCRNGCLSMSATGLVIDRENCQACGKCAEACPSGALEALGRTVSVPELLAELRKDRAYYEKSGGGVTLSGGEPTFQPDFAEALLRGLKEIGIATALDTCGLCSQHTLDRLLPYTDLVLFDLKLWAAELHQQFTGVSNLQILENLQYIQEYIHRQVTPIQLWIRTPLIPGATATDENLAAIGRYLADTLDGTVERWELCAFNNLCRDQYARLGLEWAYAKTPLMTRLELAHCEQAARGSGFHPELVLATGATRADEPT